MKQGFIKVAAVTPKIRVADPVYNSEVICKEMETAYGRGAKIIVFPELCLTGYTCGDLFLQQILLQEAKTQLLRIAKATENKDALVMVGLPVEKSGKLYNVAAVLHNGEILGLVPKGNIPNYAEFYEGRHFTKGNAEPEQYEVSHGGNGEQSVRVPFGTNILFQCADIPELKVACEICEDLWVVAAPGNEHAIRGASIIANLSASNEAVGKDEYRELLVKSASARMHCGYVYASAGEGESTQDLMFGGHNLIAENGKILAQSKTFQAQTVYADIDVQKIVAERMRIGGVGEPSAETYVTVDFRLNVTETELEKSFARMPFVPTDADIAKKRCEEILSIQAYGLKHRLEHIGAKTAVLGISGGLDSTLALLVVVKAFDLLGLPRSGITAVTMPCFGTTDRTYENACKLIRLLGATFREVDIKQSVQQHFADIGHDVNVHDVVYENAQARERTQVLMDIANQVNGLVIGTGDMSELALGWATYNGDHMSMYGVNAGVPKTLVRYLVKYCQENCALAISAESNSGSGIYAKNISENGALAMVLADILDTPVSPELLPAVDGEIAQKTEDLVGPYELHDFFLFYVLRYGFAPAKVYRLAKHAFDGVYEDAYILKWLKKFYSRFFSQQFKRSCLPDGPKVGSVGVSPRGDLRMPTDACMNLWMAEVEKL